MKNRSLYLPIKSTSLPHYFGKGIVLPSKFYNNKPSDIQDIFGNQLFLSEHRWYKDSDCSIEIILADTEEPFLIFENGYYLLNGALPISRIKNVFFLDENQMKTTEYNINAGAGFLPQKLITIDRYSGPFHQIPNLNRLSREINDNLVEKIKRFDILLGGVSFMRILQDKNEKFPVDYYSVIGFFNPYMLDLAQVSSSFKASMNGDRLTSIFTGKKSNEYIEILKSYIFDEVDFDDVDKVAKHYGIKIQRQFGLVNLENIPVDSPIFTLIILATYGNSKSQSIDDFIYQLKSNKFSQQKAQELALIFGLNIRYSGLRNKYKVGGNEIKFKMDTSLDYYILESIFQYVFYGIRSSRPFPYVDDLGRANKSNSITKDEKINWQNSFNPIPNEDSLQNSDLILNELLTPLLEKIKNKTSEFQEDILQIATKTIEDSLRSLHMDFQRKTEKLLSEIKQLKDVIAHKNDLLNHISNDVLRKNTENKDYDELEKLEIKDLKKIAKQKGIASSKINSIKQTKSGLEELIKLINNTQTLL
ncbi:hypothetical protein GM921_15110 [Pedobacter sp. LMG 31464]|uniref:2-Component system ADP-ribosyltransferase domain-containing protein n=1 Tax=Pedobacter planticolens TaxID=2679964 RepID=A0A923E174_9SPHI|nr:hypothetical protein [Pedobacter planticolens]MBB2146831.1 hypothetical protein [Pedobacter planticolens]